MCSPSILNYVRVEHLTPVQKAQIKKELAARRRELNGLIKGLDRTITRLRGGRRQTKAQVRKQAILLGKVAELKRAG